MSKRAMSYPWLILLLAVSAMGHTIYVDVDGGGDFVSIGEGVSAASDGDTVLVAPGTYTGPENLGIDFEGRNLHLKAVEGPDSTIINAASEDTVAILLHTGEDTTSVIQGFTITGAYTAIIAAAASPVIDNCVIRDPVGAEGIRCDSSGATIRRSQFLWGDIGSLGATGIHCSGASSLLIGHCSFSTYGSAIVSEEACTLLIRDCQFLNCVDTYLGGAGARVLYGDISCEDCIFYNCTTENPMRGFGIAIWAWDADVSLKRVQFLGNGWDSWSTSDWSVLSIRNSDYPPAGKLLMDEVVLWGSSTQSSTVFTDVDSLVIRRSTFADNVVWREYPFIIAPNNVTIEGCILAYNTGCELLDAPNVVTSHSCVFGNSMGDSLGGTHSENLFTWPLFCDRDSGDLTLHDDSPCLPAGNPWGASIGAWGAGGCGTGIDDESASVTSAHIQWIRPNPSTASGSRIHLAGVPQCGALVSVFDLRGRLVRCLRVDHVSSGRADCLWDLEDDHGKRVASGIYFALLSCSGTAVDRAKLVVVR